MGFLLIIGTLLIAFGPSFVFFVTTVSRRPYLLVVSQLGFLQGILSLLISGIVYSIWNIWDTPLSWVMILLNVLIEEALRPVIYKVLVICCKKLNAVQIPLTITVPSDVFKLSVCIGMGNGFLHVLTISLVSLSSSGSQADFYILQCSCISIYVLTAIEALCIMPMHVIWCYLTLQDYSKSYKLVPILIFIWHLIVGFVTLLNSYNNGCIITLIFFIVMGCTCLFCMCRLVANANHLIRPSKK